MREELNDWLKDFIKNQQDLSKETQDMINNEFWEMI